MFLNKAQKLTPNVCLNILAEWGVKPGDLSWPIFPFSGLRGGRVKIKLIIIPTSLQSSLIRGRCSIKNILIRGDSTESSIDGLWDVF